MVVHLASVVGFDGNVNIASVGGTPVGGASLPVNDAGGSLTVDGAVSVSTVLPGTGATNLGKAEDATHSSGDVGVMALAVRNDVGTALAGNGDYIPLMTDDLGRLRIFVGNNVNLAATRVENAVVAGGHSVFPAGVVRDDALGTLGVADGDWTNLRVSDRGAIWTKHDGDVEVVQSTHDDLQANVTLQLQNVDIVAGAGLGVTRTARIPVSEYGTAGLPNVYYNLLGVAELPGVGITDPTALRACSVNAPMQGGTGGALKTGPDRDTIVTLFSAQVFNNTTTTASSALLAVDEARWLVIYIDLAESGAATAILLEAEFSNDGGTTWFKWTVDQWVDLRYVVAQMPLTEAVPLNYVIGTDFRLTATAFGTTASDTITLSAYAEAIS